MFNEYEYVFLLLLFFQVIFLEVCYTWYQSKTFPEMIFGLLGSESIALDSIGCANMLTTNFEIY